MDNRRLLSITVLYGIADMVVLAVGGFLLLPLYTRTLSQSEFGTYVVVRTNIELITFLLYFGLPSAVARVYFDHKKTGQQAEYLSSVLMFFLLVLGLFAALSMIWGTRFWALLSPATPADPYLGFSVAIAAVGFFAALGALWLRLDGRAVALVSLQVGTSIVLAAAAVVNLVVLDLGLSGLLFALLISSACSGMVLPWLLGRGFRPAIRWAHIAESLPYAVPIVVGYVAYFVLNRIGTLILQRHVAIDQIAIFGLAQQLATVVTIAAAAFGKAAQPAVFAAEPAQAAELMQRSGKLLMLLMFGVTSAALLLAGDIFALVAPKSYGGGYEIMLILLVASFAYSFTLIFNTALLYHRRPRTSVAVSIFGAVISAALGMWLVPLYGLYGAALATTCAFFAMTLLSHWIAGRLTGHSYLAPMLLTFTAVCGLAALMAWLQRQDFATATNVGLKLAAGGLIFSTIYVLHHRKAAAEPCVR